MLTVQPIIGIISFVGSILIFTSPFIEGNWILTSSIAFLIFLEGLYYFLKGKKNILKGAIKMIGTIALTASMSFAIPFHIAVVVGTALLITAIYDAFPLILEN